MFHKTTPELQDQDQDHSVQGLDQDQDRFFGLRPVLPKAVWVPAAMNLWTWQLIAAGTQTALVLP